MKRLLIELAPAWLLLMIFGLIVLHAPMTVVVSTYFPDIGVGFKAWKEVLMVLAAGTIAVAITQRRMWGAFVRDKLLWVILAYIVLHIVTVLVAPLRPSAELAGLAIDLRYIVYFCLVYALLKLYPQYRSAFIKVGIVGALIVVGFAVLQQVLPRDVLTQLGYDKSTTIAPYLTVDENPDYVRINSTLRGPNPLGAYAVIVLAGLTAFVLRKGLVKNWSSHPKVLLGLLLIGALVALWTSFSRSALGAAIVALILVAIVRFWRRMTKWVWIGVGASMLVVALFGLVLRDTVLVRNVIFHDNPTTGAQIDSNSAHADSLVDGINRMSSQPVGAGVGSTGSPSLMSDRPLIIENQYLMIAHESGWVGLALFIMIFGIVIVRLWRYRAEWLGLATFASGIGLALIGILLPIWADDTVSIVWWGLAAIVLAKGGQYERTSNKKAA